jgi:cation diffusion facilitator CzcD-associated flavoprotein CzcO
MSTGRATDVVIVGSGFAGLGMAIAIKCAGMDDFVVLERAGELGGTWRDNHYPGCACDVPAPLYSFSFAPNPHWSRLYAGSAEIRAYLEDCADRFDVRRHIRFGADVTGAHWDEEAQRWKVEIAGESALTARLIVGGFGGLNRPAYPDIDGLEDFGGGLFHSAQWNHNVPVAGKRVGVIGTGASAIQLIPRVAREAELVTVFQRTPAWVVPKLDRPIWRLEQALYARIPPLQKALRATIFAITESVGVAITCYPRLLRLGEASARRHMRRAISDPELRRRLTPSYRLGCKRILPSNDYYPALTRENVELVTAGIDRVDRSGLRTSDGHEHLLDVLVCSTGFSIGEVFAPLDITGRRGLTLHDAWAGGFEAHRGTTVAGFPNMALLSGPNTGTGSTSQVYMIEAQIHYVLEMLRTLRERRAGSIEVRPEAQAAYNTWLQEQMQRTVWLTGGCDSWYLDPDGVNRTLYPGPSSGFWRSLRCLDEGEYVIEPARRPASDPIEVVA